MKNVNLRIICLLLTIVAFSFIEKSEADPLRSGEDGKRICSVSSDGLVLYCKGGAIIEAELQ
jgi:hypothetical protein